MLHSSEKSRLLCFILFEEERARRRALKQDRAEQAAESSKTLQKILKDEIELNVRLKGCKSLYIMFR